VDRTLRAVLLAGFVTFAAIAGGGLFLGFDTVSSLVAGAVSGLIAGALIWGADRRAASFQQDAAPPPVRPGFPGPPERPDGTTPDEEADPDGTTPDSSDPDERHDQ
jgi:hypothetical protein